ARLRPLSSAHASPSTASPLLPYTTLFRSNLVGDPHRYDVTAAVPSLHVAFPLLCIFTVLRYGLPRVIAFGLSVHTLAVVFAIVRSEEPTSELQSPDHLVCRRALYKLAYV